MIPVLMITYNRLEYTKKALEALFNCKGARPFVIDNGSTDGTQEWLASQPNLRLDNSLVMYNSNVGIAGAMNLFLRKTKYDFFVCKIDNDTIVPWNFIGRMLPHMAFADIVQAKHPILKATHPGGFDDWVKGMPQKGALKFNHFVGGSGIMFRRQLVNQIPETEWKLGGWRAFQREHPELRKAFATDVEVKLLDTTEDGADYSKYPDYYVETGRIKL